MEISVGKLISLNKFWWDFFSRKNSNRQKIQLDPESEARVSVL